MKSPDDFLRAIARQWGMNPSAKCERRKGIVMYYFKGKWEPLAYDDFKATTPMVCDCTHEGLRVIASCMVAEFISASIDGREFKFQPEDFQFQYLDDPDAVPSTATASEILTNIKGKI